MEQMDKKKALEILGLNQDATRHDVSNRYGVLTRKFKTIEKDENGYTINDITKAYNLLMGITFIDKAEEERQKALRENPPLLSRIINKDPIKIENFFHYYKTHIIVGIIVLITMFSIIRSCVNNVPSDFNILFYGNIYTEQTEKISTDLVNNYSDITTPYIEVLTFMQNDPQYESAIRMKIAAMAATQELDIVLLDEVTFKEHAKQGMFLPLDDLTDDLGFPIESYVEGTEKIDETENYEPIYGPAKKYGINITESEFVKENDIYADNVIITIAVNSKRIEKAISVLKEIK